MSFLLVRGQGLKTDCIVHTWAYRAVLEGPEKMYTGFWILSQNAKFAEHLKPFERAPHLP